MSHEIAGRQPLAKPGGSAGKYFTGRGGLLAALAVLFLCFGPALYRLTVFAAGSELYSYILLMPFVSAFVIWSRRGDLPVCSQPFRVVGTAFATGGAAMLLGYWLLDHSPAKLAIEDRLAFTTFSFLLWLIGICCLFLGKQIMGRLAFSLGLLIFIVPFPGALMRWTEEFLQSGSALVAEVLFRITATTFSRAGLSFQLPGISIEVAPECSGIHSTLVLLITSLLAGYFFLRSPGKRAVLTLAVIPLALLRNGFRIFTIGQLCIHIGPEMINSPIHHKGGPIFFGLSLVPFLLLLYYLQKRERSKAAVPAAADLPGQPTPSPKGSPT